MQFLTHNAKSNTGTLHLTRDGIRTEPEPNKPN